MCVFLCDRALYVGFTVVARGAEGRQGMILIDFLLCSPPIDQIVIFVDRGSALFDGNFAFELVRGVKVFRESDVTCVFVFTFSFVFDLTDALVN